MMGNISVESILTSCFHILPFDPIWGKGVSQPYEIKMENGF
jgi:hypothetical protein